MSFYTSLKPLLPSALIAAFCLTWSPAATAQTLTTLHGFSALNNNTNADGAYPDAGLVVSGSTLYGTVGSGGAAGNGTVFAVDTDGKNFVILHSFTAFTNTTEIEVNTNSDGAHPNAGLILSGGTLYGTTISGGNSGHGTVFSVDTNGSNFMTLYNFTNGADGALPDAGLLLAGDILYGTAAYGGSAGGGTVFALNTNSAANGAGFATLYAFTNGSDGSVPYAGLILSGSTLYSTAVYGGAAGNGTVFALNTNGSDFTVLHSFTAENNGTNRDGAFPYAGLILSGEMLYGTATQGGNAGHGTVFAINVNNTNFTPLHDFTATPLIFNSDGALPYGGLVLSGDTLYGTAKLGGAHGAGTAFSVTTTGGDFKTLCSFGQGTNGVWPLDGMVLSDNALYGTANFGGSANVGVVFKLAGGSITSPPPPKSYAVSIEASPAKGGGTFAVTSYNPDGSVAFAENSVKAVSVQTGDTLLVTVSPTNDCYEFKDWTVKIGGVVYTSSVSALSVSFVVDNTATVVANFTQLQYDIQTTSVPLAGGTVSGEGLKECGSEVTLRATAKSGFKFTNWTSAGVILGDKSTLTFTANQSATIAANFLDVQAPKVTITFPVSGVKTTNAVITVLGKALDNVAVAGVYYRLGTSGSWTSAQPTSPGWATWSADVNLALGADVVEVYAVDYSGNASTPVSVKITLASTH